MSFPFKRSLSYLVLVSFFFQTLWPSVVFAADADVLRPASPRSFASSFVPKDTAVIAITPFILEAFLDDEVSGFGDLKSKPGMHFLGWDSLEEAQDHFDTSLDIQRLYPGLKITEDGLLWVRYGLAFLMNRAGHLGVCALPGSEITTDTLRIHNPHGNVLFGGQLSLSHVQVQAQNILQTSPDSLVERLEVWAMGNGSAEGRFRNEAGATLTTQDVTFHEGHLENLGTWAIDDEGVLDLHGHDCINKGTLNLRDNTVLKQQGTFGNEGIIAGSSYTLEMERGENVHTISGDDITLKVSETLTNQATGRLLGQSSLTLSGTGHVENKGTVSSSGALSLETNTFTNQKLMNVDGPFHLAVQNRFTNSGTGSVVALGSTTFTGKATLQNDAPSTDHAGLAFGGEGIFRDFEGQVVNAGLMTFQTTVTGNLRKLVNRGTFGVNGAYQQFRILDFFNDTTGRVLGKGLLTLTGINRGLMQADHLLLDIEESFTHEAGGLLKGQTCIETRGLGIFHRHGALQTPFFRVETNRFDNAVSLIDDTMDVVIGATTSHWHTPKDVTVAVNKLTLEGPSENEDEEEATLDALNEGTLTVGTFINGRAFTNRGSLTLGTWHQSDSVFKNELGGMIDVSGVTEFETDTLDNSGDITFEEKVTGRLHQIHNKGGLFFKKDATLRGFNLLNQKILKAGGLFQWEGRTLENGETAKMILGDNRITATHQLLNKGLFLWKENTAKTDHFLNLGWAEKTAELDKTLPASFRRSADKRTPFKKSTLENRGVLKLTQPLLSIQDGGQFDHWLNTGVMKLPSTSLQAQSFKNTGDLFVEGSLTGQVTTFESTKKLVSTRKIDLTGETFTTREGGEISSQQTVSLKSSTPLTVNGKIQSKRGVTLTAPQIENKGTLIVKTGALTLNGAFRNEGNLNTDALVYDGLDLINEGTLEANSYDRGGVLRMLSNGRNKILTIRDGRFIAKKLQNRGQMVLAGGIYQIETTWDNRDGKADVGTLFLTSSSPVLEGSLDVTSLLAPSTPYQKLWVKGNTVIRSGAFQTKNLTNTGTLSLGNGRYHADLFEIAEGAKLVTQRGMSMTVKDMTNNGDIVSPTSLKLTSLQGVKKLGRVSVEEDLLVELPHWSDAWSFLYRNKDQWAIGRHLKVTAGLFRNWHWIGRLTLPYPVFLTVQDFFITNTFSIKGLTLQSQTFQLGDDNNRLGTVESHGPLILTVQQDIDCRFGVIKATEKTDITASDGVIQVGNPRETVETVEDESTNLCGNAAKSTHQLPVWTHNGAKILTRGALTLQSPRGHIVTSFGSVHGDAGTTLSAGYDGTIRNQSGSITSANAIFLTAAVLENLIGEVIRFQGHSKPIIMTSLGVSWHSFDVARSREHPQSGPGIIASTGGNIFIAVQRGVNLASKILTPRSLQYRDRGSYTDHRPSSFEVKELPLVAWFSEANRRSPYGSLAVDREALPSIPGVIRAGERLDMQLGLLHLTGNISAPVVRIRGDELLAQNTGGARQGIPDRAFEIDLRVFHEKLAEHLPIVKNLVQQHNQNPLQANGVIVSDPQTAVVPVSSSPLRTPSIAPSLPPLALTDEALKFTVMFALSDMLGILNIGGHSGDELLTRLFKKTKQIEKQLHKNGKLITRDNLQSFHEGMIYTVLEQIGNEMRQVPKLFITPDMVNPYGQVSGAITGTQIDLEFQSGVEGNLTAAASSVGRAKDYTLKDKKAPLRTLEEDEEKSDESDEDIPALRPEPNLNLSVEKGPINLTQSVLTSDGKATLKTEQSGNINLTASKLEGEKDVLVNAAGSAQFVSTSSRSGNGENFAEHANQTAVISQEGKLTIKSKLDTVFIGAKTFSKTGTFFEGDGNLVDQTLSLMFQTVTRDGKNWTRDTSVIKHPSQHTVAEGNLSAAFAGRVDVVAAHYDVPETKEVAFFGGQGVSFHEDHNTHEHESHQEKKGGGWFGRSSTTHFQWVSQTSIGVKVKGGKTKIVSGADITLTNVNFETNQTILTALDGIVKVLPGTNFYTSAFTGKSQDMFWQNMTQRLIKQQTYTDSQFKGTIETYTKEVIVQQVLGRVPAFMQQLHLNGGKLTIDYVRELYDVQEHSVSGPTAAFSAVIALAASIAAYASGGMTLAGSGAVSALGVTQGTLAATVVHAMGAAGFSALCAQSAMALVNNQLDIGRAAQDLVNKNTVKALVKAMAAAGLVAGLGSAFNIPTAAGEVEGLTGHVQSQLIRQGVGVALDIASGERPEDALQHGLRAGVAGVVGGLGANYLSRALDAKFIDQFTHKLGHALVGGVMGGILGGQDGVISGAIAAPIAEAIACMIKENPKVTLARALEKAQEQGLDPTPETITHLVQEDLQSTINLGRLGGAITGLLAGQDVSIAIEASTNAVENNFSVGEVKACLRAYAEGVADQLKDVKEILQDLTSDQLERLADFLEANKREVSFYTSMFVLAIMMGTEDNPGRKAPSIKIPTKRDKQAAKLKKDGIMAIIKASPKAFRELARKISSDKKAAASQPRTMGERAGAQQKQGGVPATVRESGEFKAEQQAASRIKGQPSSWTAPQEAINKVPASLGQGVPNKSGEGMRWYSKHGQDVVRIDKGDIKADWPSQKVDHVSIVRDGKTIGKDGQVIQPTGSCLKPSQAEEAHIPLSDWLQWREWYKP